MNSRRFRFRPPLVTPSPELAWVLEHAFSSTARPDRQELTRPLAAVELAARLSLLPRIATRSDLVEIARDLDSESADRIRRARLAANAAELKLDATLELVSAAADAIGVEVAVLKGRAIAVAGHSPPGGRLGGDIDLLVPETALEPLRRELVRRGFRETAGTGYEHQLPALHDPSDTGVELHRHLPGVRIHRRRSATWDDLLQGDLLRRLPPESNLAPIRVPAREVLIAHALVHVLAQHGLSTSYPGWWLIADLIDLSILDPATRSPSAAWRSWVADDVSPREVSAALELASRVEAGSDPFTAVADDAARLALHFVACALDPEYGLALKARWLESPVSDRPRWLARITLLLRTFAPPRSHAPNARPPGDLRRAAGWLARPFVLAGKAARTALAVRRTRMENRP